MADDRRRGFALVLLSASGFASLAIFGKQAYEAGFDVPEVLAVRFVLATPLLLAIALATKRSLRLPRPVALRVFAMGALGYAIQATLFFAALSRIPASLTGLLLYLYPALVTVGAVALGRHRANRLTVVGLALALLGTALIVGLPAGRVDPLGVVLALLAAVWYSGYILIGEQVLADVDPLVVSVYVCAGAATSFVVVGGGVLRDLDFAGVQTKGWAPLAGMAVFATALAISAFFAGMARIGSTWAAITSSWEPVATVVLGVLILHDHLAAGIVAGGAAVVVGAIVLPLVGAGAVEEPVPPPP
ncbi:MAG TPA: DMT family transporter [Acidimicrobiales bacterium]|jgi:drug/metabolite transporter (DMT)-like permease|nr:DMT family transporter [Acidimicrobiales bacterium]